MKRILILGPSGSGKSTLARQLGSILGLDVIHLDAWYWQPGWQEPCKEEWLAQVGKLTDRTAWIMDGNYRTTFSVRLPRADTIIYLSCPRYLSYAGIIKRYCRYAGRTRPDLGAGCPEHIDWEFIRWIWRFPRHHEPGIFEKLQNRRADQRLIELTSRAAVRRFTDSLGSRVQPAVKSKKALQKEVPKSAVR